MIAEAVCSVEMIFNRTSGNSSLRSCRKRGSNCSIVASRPMLQANLFLLLDALTHQRLLCARGAFLGRRKYDPSRRWQHEPPAEDDFCSSGDFGVDGLLRAVVKALEAQGRGFAHGHEKTHGEPRTKAN